MATQFCTNKMEEYAQLVRFKGTLILTLCVLNLHFSLVATVGNLFVIRALWKASSIPPTIRKVFLSLAFSDLAVGSLVQSMRGVIIAVMLRMATNGNYNFGFLCPTIITIWFFFEFLLACASFLSVTAIAVDRVLAVSLHLRYQELVTSKRVVIALVSLWITSGVGASIFILLPNHKKITIVIVELAGLLLTTVAYIRIYKTVKCHQNQIQTQHQSPSVQATEPLREKKSALNALFVYIVFVACYLPRFCSTMMLHTINSGISSSAANDATILILLLNSSLNPILYCWRYREIREIVKNTVKNIFRVREP